MYFTHRPAIIVVSVMAGLASSMVSAQVTTNFRAERQRIEASFDTKGLTEAQILHNRLLNPFASPGLRIQKVLPGSSLAVTVRGDFPAGTKILSERDGVTLSGAVLSTTTYSARLAIPPDEGPGFVRLWAFTPIEISGPTAVALVDVLYRIELKSPNGYTIKIAPVEKTFTILDNKHAQVKYQEEFYKPGESKPFETMAGYQMFEVDDAPAQGRTGYPMLSFDFGESTTSPQAQIEALNNKMADPKTTEAERNALMARMGEVQRKMLEDMAKGLQTDPASLNKKQDDFGCGDVQLYASKGGFVEGRISCGQNFNDGELKVSGTMTPVRR